MRGAGREWPLVAFTLLTQAAVGAFVALGAARIAVTPEVPDELLAQLLGGALAAVLLACAAGLAASAGHLARPWQAWRALRNPARSWLSLEIVMAAGFAIALAIFAGLLRLGPADSSGPRELVGGVTAALGVGLVYAMGQVYRLPTRPAWNRAATSIGFFATAALLGALAASTAIALAGGDVIGPASAFPDRVVALDRAVRLLLAAALAATAVESAILAVDLRAYRGASAAASLPASASSAAARRRAAAARGALLAIAASATAWFIFRVPAVSVLEPEGTAAIGVALAAASVEALIGRVLFYTDPPIAGL